jgi:hypothetical protein
VIRGLYSLNAGRLIARADRRRWVLLEEVGRSGRVRTSVVSRARHAQLAIHWPTGSAVLWTARSRYLGSKLTRFDAEAGTTRTDSPAAMEGMRIHLDKNRIAFGGQGTHAYYVEVDDKRPWYRLPSELHGWCGGFLVSDFGLHAVEEGLPVVLEVPVRREAGCTATLWPVDRGCVIQHPDGSVSLVDMTGTEPRAEALSVVGQHDGEPL